MSRRSHPHRLQRQPMPASVAPESTRQASERIAVLIEEQLQAIRKLEHFPLPSRGKCRYRRRSGRSPRRHRWPGSNASATHRRPARPSPARTLSATHPARKPGDVQRVCRIGVVLQLRAASRDGSWQSADRWSIVDQLAVAHRLDHQRRGAAGVAVEGIEEGIVDRDDLGDAVIVEILEIVAVAIERADIDRRPSPCRSRRRRRFPSSNGRRRNSCEK